MIVRFFFDFNSEQYDCFCTNTIEWPCDCLPRRGDMIWPGLLSDKITWGDGSLSYENILEIIKDDNMKEQFKKNYQRCKTESGLTEKESIFKAASFFIEDMFFIDRVLWNFDEGRIIPRILLINIDPFEDCE